MATATIIGSTGLIGGELTRLAQADPFFTGINLLVRRPVAVSNSKTKVTVIDFENKTAFRDALSNADIIFSAIGSTQKKVNGDMAAYRRIDYDINVDAARFGKEAGSKQFLMVSSAGASKTSGNFYLSLKGETEDAVIAASLWSISIFRPSMLLGTRSEKRPAERVGQIFMQLFSFAFIGKLKKYRAITATGVAAAMIEAAKQNKPGVHFYHYDEIMVLTHSSHS